MKKMCNAIVSDVTQRRNVLPLSSGPKLSQTSAKQVGCYLPRLFFFDREDGGGKPLGNVCKPLPFNTTSPQDGNLHSYVVHT